MTFWKKGGKVIVDDKGKPIICDHCPCISSSSSFGCNTACIESYANHTVVVNFHYFEGDYNAEPGNNCPISSEVSFSLTFKLGLVSDDYTTITDTSVENCVSLNTNTCRITAQYVAEPTTGNTGIAPDIGNYFTAWIEFNPDGSLYQGVCNLWYSYIFPEGTTEWDCTNAGSYVGLPKSYTQISCV